MFSYITVSITQSCSHDLSSTHNMMCKNVQCCPVSSVHHHVPGEHRSSDPCSPGTWRKLGHTMRLHRFFGSTTILGGSVCILCCCILDDNTNLLRLFRDITKQILTVSLDQHRKIIPGSCAMLPSSLCLSARAILHKFGALFFSVAIGTSQYLYNVCRSVIHLTM